ncbi:hypothetical protein CDAR_611581 [Caerostris darwini]|uniref:Uncharacterized protein n=1 Tax=Caerostris darwini TaxID=1538125 RepID=A0AAV4U2V4_9ARAC|nr:hypothetical protein CDAR_611581 [Caerostris darwini]
MRVAGSSPLDVAASVFVRSRSQRGGVEPIDRTVAFSILFRYSKGHAHRKSVKEPTPTYRERGPLARTALCSSTEREGEGKKEGQLSLVKERLLFLGSGSLMNDSDLMRQ